MKYFRTCTLCNLAITVFNDSFIRQQVLTNLKVETSKNTRIFSNTALRISNITP